MVSKVRYILISMRRPFPPRYWNRYPGCACDVQSVYYSYSFSEELQQDWKWPLKYSAQPDILKYADHVADRFDLKEMIRFSTEVVSCVWDEGRGRYAVETNRGDTVSARHVVLAIGSLSMPQLPKECLSSSHP